MEQKDKSTGVDINSPVFKQMVQDELQELVQTYGLTKAHEIVINRTSDDEFNIAFEAELLAGIKNLELLEDYKEGKISKDELFKLLEIKE